MLVQKLLRIDDATVNEIEELSKKLSETEYTSFSALTRKLIRKGLDNMETENFINKVRKTSDSFGDDNKRVLLKFHELIDNHASVGGRLVKINLVDVHTTIMSALNNEVINCREVDLYRLTDILHKILFLLKQEGFDVSFIISNDYSDVSVVFLTISW